MSPWTQTSHLQWKAPRKGWQWLPKTVSILYTISPNIAHKCIYIAIALKYYIFGACRVIVHGRSIVHQKQRNRPRATKWKKEIQRKNSRITFHCIWVGSYCLRYELPSTLCGLARSREKWRYWWFLQRGYLFAFPRRPYKRATIIEKIIRRWCLGSLGFRYRCM